MCRIECPALHPLGSARALMLYPPARMLRQVLEGHIRVRMFGVGRIVEGIVKDSLTKVRGGGAGTPMWLP